MQYFGVISFQGDEIEFYFYKLCSPRLRRGTNFLIGIHLSFFLPKSHVAIPGPFLHQPGWGVKRGLVASAVRLDHWLAQYSLNLCPAHSQLLCYSYKLQWVQ